MSEDRKPLPLRTRVRPKNAAAVLVAEDRKPVAPKPDAEQPKIEQPDTTAEESAAAVEQATPAPKTRSAKPPTPPKAEKDVPLGVLVSPTLKGRARAAYKEASYRDDVPSFKTFIENAIEAEIRRIEIAHNNGDKFEPRHENLRAGRPAQGQ